MDNSEIIKNLPFLTKTDLSDGVSFIAGCTFWKTKYDNIYLTDYDLQLSGFFAECGYNFNLNKDEIFKKANLLKYKNLVTLFYFGKGFFLPRIISGDLLRDENKIIQIIEDLNIEVNKKING